MSVTAAAMTNMLNYLFAAGALNVRDDQPAVWVDYVGFACPDVRDQDLLPAARDAIREWAGNNRSWQVDAARFAAAVRRVRNQRVADDESRHGQITAPNLDGQAATRWLQAVRRAVADGACRAEAEAAAWAVVGRRPPALIDGTDVLGGLTGAERARAVLARLAAGHEGADTSNRHGEGSGAAQNMPDAPREGWADSVPATGRTANRPVGRVIV